ncbi:MAG: hypothetical protein K6A90_00320 [Lachnospiraceae bacterium]|nr:hypothetical protein [Lachnospiraceae bacterium]
MRCNNSMDINLNKQSKQQIFKTKEDVIKDINFAPAWENENLNDRDSSFCVLINGTIKAYIAIEKMRDDMIEIPALWSALSDPRIMMIMLQEAAAKLKEKYDPDTRTAMIALNSMSDKIIKHLFPNAVPCSYSFISI